MMTETVGALADSQPFSRCTEDIVRSYPCPRNASLGPCAACFVGLRLFLENEHDRLDTPDPHLVDRERLASRNPEGPGLRLHPVFDRDLVDELVDETVNSLRRPAERFPVPGPPVLDAIPPPRAQLGKQRRETTPRRLEKVRPVIDEQIHALRDFGGEGARVVVISHDELHSPF